MPEPVDLIREFLSDPDAPWYGSDFVPLVADLCDECERLKQQLTESRESLKQIVCTEGQDRGLVLQDHESPTKYNEVLKFHVYEHDNFSPLGDALISLWEQLQG